MKTQEILGIEVKESAASRNLTYTQFTDELLKYDKLAILQAASSILWQIWRKPNAPPGRENDYELCRTYASRIAVIKAASGKSSSSPRPISEPEFIKLVHEYLGIHEPLTDHSFFKSHEGPEFLNALQAHEAFKNFVPPVDVLHGYTSRLTILRTLRSQWDYRSASPTGIFRSWEIVSRLNKQHHGQIFDRLKATLNIDPKDYVRAGMVLLSSGNMYNHLGLMIPQELVLSKDVADTLNLDAEAVHFVASRLAQRCDDLEQWHQSEVNALPEQYRKYAPHPLVARPLIQIDSSLGNWSGKGTGYLCPSPAHLVWRMQSACIDAIRLLPKSTPSENLMSDLGACLSSYLHEFLSTTLTSSRVVNLDSIGDQQEKHADFLIIAGDLALIIESKTSLGPTSAKSTISPTDTVNVWGRMLRAYQQCAHTIKSGVWSTLSSTSVKRFASIVCFDENMCPEGAVFNDFGTNSGLFASLSLGPTEAVSMQELEDLLGTFGAEKLGELIISKWAQGKQGDMLRAFANSSKQALEIDSPSLHLRNAENEIFPGYKPQLRKD
ncbi:MAG: hypothetical protein EOO71_05565 [Myxococcaceae bacterium]|nr:MAG: hypothetical protein EOO71_05565 [Myxococcaceae bacterium]